ncbi:MAG TPA: serine/threonine protein kinase, partial [Planctomycetes bacterium]|nr:serine/threonine protein kinase [Planctomycetota bacterium]
RCLEKEPARRYPNGAALAQELRRFLEGEAVEARPLTRLERTRRWARRNRALAGLSAASALALTVLAVAALAGGVWSYRETQAAWRAEQARAEEARRER